LGFRFFCLMNMIMVCVLAFAKSLVDQLRPLPFVRFCSMNLIGFTLFLGSITYGKNITKPRHLWFNNAFLVSGIVLILYGSTVEIQGAVAATYLPIFYAVEVFILLVIGNKAKMESSEEIYTTALAI